ncbi:MAG: cobalamin-binding protein [Euryarchaeota archaeon]|nr:cobalamin-binding protein [Euryarchaeota archaeon]
MTVTIILIFILGAWIAYREQIKPKTEAEFPLLVKDDLGRSVKISKQPERVISLAPSNTEILFALELGDKIIAVTKFCDYPLNATKKEKIGGFSDINMEKVVALKPDLVLATGGVQEQIVKELERLNITVIALDAKNITEILANIELVGKVTGQEKSAQELTTNMKQRIKKITGKTKDLTKAQKLKIYYEVWHDPLMTAGPETFIHNIIELAGGVNIFADAKIKYPRIDPETILARNPEIIITSLGAMGGATAEQIKTRPGWNKIDAVKNNRVYEIDENILRRPGPRIIDGLEAMAKIIHPELFSR